MNNSNLPIVSQPTTDDYSNSGFNKLALVDHFLIHHETEGLRNKYIIQNGLGQEIFLAVENSNCCSNVCCDTLRPFNMTIFDHRKEEIIYMSKPMGCTSCLFPCCLQTMKVYTPQSHFIASVRQEWRFCLQEYTIRDENEDIFMRIKGPFSTISGFCKNLHFEILTADGRDRIGALTKQWSGFEEEAFTDADNFEVSFPVELDVKSKAILLSACFLVDFIYFEKTH